MSPLGDEVILKDIPSDPSMILQKDFDDEIVQLYLYDDTSPYKESQEIIISQVFLQFPIPLINTSQVKAFNF